MANEANFQVLVTLTGLRKKDIAKRLGVRPYTISTWKNAAPHYAVAYLQLYLDMMALKRELEKSRSVITEYCDLKIKTKELSELASQMTAVAKKES